MEDLQTLKADAEIWVDRMFNQVPLAVAERMAEDMLFEHIDLSDYDEDYDGEPPYPMWGTLFHFRGNACSDFIESAKEAGFLVIQDVPEFDGVMLGVQGAGYSFYGAHWLPLYVAVLGLKEKFKGVSFDHL